MPQSLLPIAQSQIGNSGGKYQSWAGIGSGDWCAAFVSWCADQAGYNLVDWTDVTSDPNDFPFYVTVGRGARWFNWNNRLQYSLAHGGNYTPNPGDIIFFAWDSNPDLVELWHTGIVESVTNGRIYTVEGNTGDPRLVRRNDYDVYDPDVICFGMMNGTNLTVTDYVISAICGNFWRESTMNPGIWESLIPSTWDHVYQYDGIGGYGLGGFTNTYQSSTGLYDMRLERYHDWCVANGYHEDDGSATMYYIVFVERLWAGHYNNDAFDDWLNTTETDLYTLTDDWCRRWEGNPGDHMGERYAHAQTAYDYIQQHKGDDPRSYSWVSGNFFCSEPQILNNTMCIYFWFTSYYTPGGGGGGNKPKRNKRLPIWMMLRSPTLY